MGSRVVRSSRCAPRHRGRGELLKLHRRAKAGSLGITSPRDYMTLLGRKIRRMRQKGAGAAVPKASDLSYRSAATSSRCWRSSWGPNPSARRWAHISPTGCPVGTDEFPRSPRHRWRTSSARYRARLPARRLPLEAPADHGSVVALHHDTGSEGG